MRVEELKHNLGYEYECNMTEEYRDMEVIDEWGSAIVWSNDDTNNDIGVEYNFCIDGNVNSSAIYKMKYNKETECMETDCDTFVHYEIDFNNKGWVHELENAMCEALIKFYDL